MSEFLASDNALIFGLLLLLVAFIDYVFIRYFAKNLSQNNPAMQEALRRVIGMAPYWIAICVVGGLFLIMKYMEAN